METATETHSGLRAGTTARILYVNGYAQTSERTIDVIRRFAGSNGVTYLRAFCRLRGEERTFRTDRILAVLSRDAAAASGPTYGHQPAAAQSAQPARSTPAGHPHQPPTAPVAAARRARPGRAFFRVVLALALVLGGARLLQQAQESGAAGWSRISPAPPVVTAAVARVEPPAPRPAPQPSPAPQPDGVREVEYRGRRVEVRRSAGRTSWTVADTGRTYASAHEMRVAVNSRLFSNLTGITDSRVIGLFAAADRDRDGEVSWEEVRQFQESLNRTYRYQPNSRALRPDEFIAAGGGDCEDWALMTAGMLRFWGIPVFVGSLSSSTGHHAVALVPTTHLPPGARTIDVPAGNALRAGSYVPIDYTHVGRLSNAVASRFRVERIWVPEEIYGWAI